MVGDATRLLALAASRKGVELVCRVDPQLPEQLLGDPGRIRQVVVNLVGNAVKFTSEGEVYRQRMAGDAARTAEAVCISWSKTRASAFRKTRSNVSSRPSGKATARRPDALAARGWD